MEQAHDQKKFLEQTYDKRLDRLYTSKVRCPYCNNKIQKLQTTCSKCGLNKIQIAYASHKRAKEMIKNGESGKIVMMRRRPTDLKFWKVSMCLIPGIFGVHNFYTGRRNRGWIMLGFMILFIGLFILLQTANPETGEGMSWILNNYEEFSTVVALCSSPSLVLWISDIFGIVLGFYKYPVRLGEVKDAGKAWAK